MKSVFMALWCFCFLLIAVIGCDQGMNMMKPAVQEVMDSKPEDQLDTTVPVSQPVAEVKKDESMMDPAVPEPDVEVPPVSVEETPVQPIDMEPTVPEPDVEEPPMLVEETPVEPPDMAEEAPEEPSDPYVPLEGLVVSNGRVQYLFFSAGACINLRGGIINGVAYNTHSSKWQRREDATSPWIDIPGTENDGGLCSYFPPGPGQYRLVCEISIGGVRGKYASENILEI